MVEYRFSFNKGIAAVLGKLCRAGGPVELRTLNLTSSEWTNAQKVRYWGLAESVKHEGDRKGGWWKITAKGKDFVEGRIKIQRMVVMYRNQFVRYCGDETSFSEIHPGYMYRPDYSETAVPHEVPANGESECELFL